ncbi:unnamed protein product [Paramecium primaurelia]|uniref:Transmembrane protein n=1 Tax=Paramecium primaurelia TaxID=5886 RepID=A0A8S1NZB7_PARPR|nr:unnamed protein product [Paramecium primaurelia]
MGGGQSKAQKLQSQQRANKPQLPQHQTPKQHNQFLISEPIQRYFWNSQFDYENLISEILFSISIKRCMEYLQQFKLHMRYIKKARNYIMMLHNVVYMNQNLIINIKNNDCVLIPFFSLYHISKFQVIFSSSDKKWWEGKYFVITQKKYVKLYFIIIFIFLIISKILYHLKRKALFKLLFFLCLTDYQLQFLYSDSISYLTDIDQFVKEQELIKQQNYQTYRRSKLESNVEKQKQQQQLLYQQQLQDSKIPTQQIDDMEKQFKFLSDHSLIEIQEFSQKQKQVQETQKSE